jgi:nitrile hydratase
MRTMALEAALVEKGVITTDVVDAFIETVETHMGPHQGARVVAKAWVDPAYKERLLDDAPAAIGELGIAGPQADDLRVVENTPAVHNLVVCTLCSCYPWAILGLPPAWYKDFAYRSRAVAEPRAVLAEFGTDLDPDVEVRVWDSSASTRYFVLPERPAGTDDLDEDELAKMVTRDAMIGVTKVAAPT